MSSVYNCIGRKCLRSQCGHSAYRNQGGDGLLTVGSSVQWVCELHVGLLLAANLDLTNSHYLYNGILPSFIQN